MMSSGLSQLGFEDYKSITQMLLYKLEVWNLNDADIYQVGQVYSNKKMLFVALWEM